MFTHNNVIQNMKQETMRNIKCNLFLTEDIKPIIYIQRSLNQHEEVMSSRMEGRMWVSEKAQNRMTTGVMGDIFKGGCNPCILWRQALSDLVQGFANICCLQF